MPDRPFNDIRPDPDKASDFLYPPCPECGHMQPTRAGWVSQFLGVLLFVGMILYACMQTSYVAGIEDGRRAPAVVECPQ